MVFSSTRWSDVAWNVTEDPCQMNLRQRGHHNLVPPCFTGPGVFEGWLGQTQRTRSRTVGCVLAKQPPLPGQVLGVAPDATMDHMDLLREQTLLLVTQSEKSLVSHSCACQQWGQP